MVCSGLQLWRWDCIHDGQHATHMTIREQVESPMNRWVLVLAGGRGERFWPWSRPERPKQLLPLAGGRTLLEATIQRALELAPRERIVVLTARDLADEVRRQAPGVRVISEPVPR